MAEKNIKNTTDELDGYVDLGLVPEAREAGLRLLNAGFDSAESMYYVTVTMLSILPEVSDEDRKEYRAAINVSLSKLPSDEERGGLAVALVFFASLNMNSEAIEIFSKIDSPPVAPLEAAMTLDILKIDGNVEKWNEIAIHAKTMLANCSNEQTRLLLHDALEMKDTFNPESK